MRELRNSTTTPQASIEYRLIRYIEDAERPVNASEIASFLKLNPDSVRSRLSKMLRKGLLSRAHYGFYRLSSTHGVRLSRGGIRMQNVQVVASGIPIRPVTEEQREERKEGRLKGRASVERYLKAGHLVSIRIQFGASRGKITYHVGAPLGVCPVGLALVHLLVTREVEDEGYTVPEEEWKMKDCEFLEDYTGFKLEGMQAATFWGVLGELEKYYTKPGVRREVRTSSTEGVRLTELRALLEGGVDASHVLHRMDIVEQRLAKLENAVKGSSRMVQATFDGLIRRAVTSESRKNREAEDSGK